MSLHLDRPVADRAGRRAGVALLACLAVLAGCTDPQQDTTASQAAVKVNQQAITVQQINFVMQQQRGLKPEQTDAVTKQVLERLIDQQLALQKAQELKLDRDPRVIYLLEAARREILARAYVDKTGEAAAKPSDADIKAYYDAHPALFSARRIYTLQELAIEAKPDQVGGLREQLKASRTVSEFIEYLKANSYRFAGSQAARSAEQLPLNMLDTLAQLSDGQALLLPSSSGAQVIVLAGSRTEPVDEARAKPAIEKFLLNDARRKRAEADIKALRTAAKIEYLGSFASAAASAPAAAAETVPIAVPPPVTATQESAPAVFDPASAGKDLEVK